jgi:CheY-like chemotaxis protein
MMNEEGGNIFRERTEASLPPRRSSSREPARILIVDPVVGSRFALAKVVAQPGVLAETASSIEEARLRLARRPVALILVDEELGEGARGLDFLVEVRQSHPAVRRALVIAEDVVALRRADLDRAGLSFVVAKPWSPAFLRSAVREALGAQDEFAAWEHRPRAVPSSRSELARGSHAEDVERRLDLLARGLLAGLNSCEAEAEVFELLHAELAESLDSQRWLWVDEDLALATRIVGDWPLESGIRLDGLPDDERFLLEHARRSSRITRLDRRAPIARDESPPTACIGFTVKDGGRRVITALVWVDSDRCTAVLALLREIQSGLQLAFRRILDAEARATAARRLARRVSEELRTPVGALSHAIDRLRGEALRAGMSTEWVDRVSSESERLARAVELFEDEMWAEPGEKLVNAN